MQRPFRRFLGVDLGGGKGKPVDYRIKDPQSEVRHADIIDVGKGEGDLQGGLPIDRVDLAVDVPARFLEAAEIHS